MVVRNVPWRATVVSEVRLQHPPPPPPQLLPNSKFRLCLTQILRVYKRAKGVDYSVHLLRICFGKHNTYFIVHISIAAGN